MSRIRSHLSYANVMATIAVFVALGGTATAAVLITGKNVKDGTLTGKDIKNNSVASVDVKDGDLLARDFKAGQLQAGPKGDKGDPGTNGTNGTNGKDGTNGVDGAPATKLFALIKSDGTIVRGSGIVQDFVGYAGNPGSHEVVFDRDISNCVYVATLANETAGRGNAAPNGQIGVRSLSTDAKGVSVTTYDNTGAAAAKSFSIAVFC